MASTSLPTPSTVLHALSVTAAKPSTAQSAMMMVVQRRCFMAGSSRGGPGHPDRAGRSQAGRLLPEPAAQLEFSVANQLYKGQQLNGKNGLNIPKPLAAFQQPAMVLYKFDPSKDLRGYLKKVAEFQEVAEVIKMVATGLRTLHRSSIDLAREETLEEALEQHRAATTRVLSKLMKASPQRGERAQQFFNHLMERAAVLQSWDAASIHGALEWNCILHGEKKFYLYKFDQCRRSHPGFDLGGFLADLLRFYLLRKKGDRDFYSRGREIFLNTYFDTGHPGWYEDLAFFVASALLLRLDRLLQRPEAKWEPKVDALLEQCEQALQ